LANNLSAASIERAMWPTPGGDCQQARQVAQDLADEFMRILYCQSCIGTITTIQNTQQSKGKKYFGNNVLHIFSKNYKKRRRGN